MRPHRPLILLAVAVCVALLALDAPPARADAPHVYAYPTGDGLVTLVGDGFTPSAQIQLWAHGYDFYSSNDSTNIQAQIGSVQASPDQQVCPRPGWCYTVAAGGDFSITLLIPWWGCGYPRVVAFFAIDSSQPQVGPVISPGPFHQQFFWSLTCPSLLPLPTIPGH